MIATPDDAVKFLEVVQSAGFLSGRVCLLGVGNRDRRDDGVGSLIAERLAKKCRALAIDAGSVPENYLENVARSCPDTVLIIDAMDFGGCPGECRLFDPDSIGPAGLSCHALSLGMTAEYLAARTQARLVLLAIQPADVRSGGVLSIAVARAAERVEEALSGALELRMNKQNAGFGQAVLSREGR